MKIEFTPLSGEEKTIYSSIIILGFVIFLGCIIANIIIILLK